jgi:aspartate-semialdehyde dehydrogenase
MKNRPVITIVGGESLIGRELRDVIQEQQLPVNIQLVAVDEQSVTLTEQEGEPAVITPLDEQNLLASHATILAGSADSSRKALALIAKSAAHPKIIDMTYVAEDEPSARLRAPLVEVPGQPAPAGSIHVVAHPAAVALAIFLQRLDESFRIRRSLAHMFEPASERGHRGLDELRRQTVGLLAFQKLPKSVYDAQLAFNLLAAYGDDAPEPLHQIELRIERHLASLLSGLGGLAMPSIRLIQAPVFHGYSISVYVEFDSRPDMRALTAALASDLVDVRDADLEPPNNAGAAGQSGIAVGSIAPDRNHPSAFWFWLVADNFRLMAENGVAVVRSLLPAAVLGERE